MAVGHTSTSTASHSYIQQQDASARNQRDGHAYIEDDVDRDDDKNDNNTNTQDAEEGQQEGVVLTETDQNSDARAWNAADAGSWKQRLDKMMRDRAMAVVGTPSDFDIDKMASSNKDVNTGQMDIINNNNAPSEVKTPSEYDDDDEDSTGQSDAEKTQRELSYATELLRQMELSAGIDAMDLRNVSSSSITASKMSGSLSEGSSNVSSNTTSTMRGLRPGGLDDSADLRDVSSTASKLSGKQDLKDQDGPHTGSPVKDYGGTNTGSPVEHQENLTSELEQDPNIDGEEIEGDHSAYNGEYGRDKFSHSVRSFIGRLNPWGGKKSHSEHDSGDVQASYGRSKEAYARDKWKNTMRSIQRQQRVNASRVLGAVAPLGDNVSDVNGTNVPRLRVLKKFRPTLWMFNFPIEYRNSVKWFFGKAIKVAGYVQVCLCVCVCVCVYVCGCLMCRLNIGIR
jgi:hypothetical protein